jgi:hypothetical protein
MREEGFAGIRRIKYAAKKEANPGSFLVNISSGKFFYTTSSKLFFTAR